MEIPELGDPGYFPQPGRREIIITGWRKGVFFFLLTLEIK